MKFLCEHCKAKYQIADDKVAGRTVRMKCRKCGGQIEVKAVTESGGATTPAETADEGEKPTALAPRPLAKPAPTTATTGIAPKKPAAPPAKPAAPRPLAPAAPRPGAAPGGSLAGAFQQNVQRPDDEANPAALDLRELSAADEWYVAVNGVPVGPVRVGEVRRKAATGAVTEESLCWQEGMEEWRPIRTVTELAAVVREAASGGVRPSTFPPVAARPLGPRSSPNRPAVKAPLAPAAVAPAAARPAPQQHQRFDAEADEATVVGHQMIPDPEPEAGAVAFQGAATRDPFAPVDPFRAAAAAAAAPLAGAGSPYAPAGAAPFASAGPAPFAPQAGAPPVAAPPPASYAGPVIGAPPIVAPTPARRISPVAVGMIVMFACFGLGAAYFVFAPKPPAPVAQIPTAAPVVSVPTAAPTDVPPPTAETAAPTAVAAAPDAGSGAKVASTSPGTRTGGNGGNPGTAATPKPGGAIDLHGLIGGGPGGPDPSGGPGGGGGGAQLNEDDVRAIVGRYQTNLKRTCWEKSGSSTPTVNEKVHIVVGGNGTVQSATADGNDAVVGHCLETQIKGWHWPGGGTVDVPFHFIRQ